MVNKVVYKTMQSFTSSFFVMLLAKKY